MASGDQLNTVRRPPKTNPAGKNPQDPTRSQLLGRQQKCHKLCQKYPRNLVVDHPSRHCPERVKLYPSNMATKGVATASSGFHMPEMWSFKPFFTIQPNVETRERQLKAWKDLTLGYCTAQRLYSIDPASFPCFRNDEIGRHLSTEGVSTVIQYLIQQGHAEWEDGLQHTRLRIILKSPQSLAADVYNWAETTGSIGTVFTIYELHASEEFADTVFHGADPQMLRRALQHLETTRRCVIIHGSTSEEDGVKFLPR